MGLFDGLFGKDKKARFDQISPFDLIPGFIQEQGRGIGSGAFDLLLERIGRGETPAATELFTRSRAQTLRDFTRATGQASVDLSRSGLRSSGTARESLAGLSRSFGQTLGRQDLQRSERLDANQLNAALQGLNAVNSLSRGTALIPRIQQKGLFDDLGSSLIGLGASGLLGGAGGGFAGLLSGGAGGIGAGFGGGVQSGLSSFGRF